MFRKSALLTAAAALFLTAALNTGSTGGQLFEDLLNAMQIDQKSPPRTGDEYLEISNQAPVGQTFIVGESVKALCRIALYMPYWHESWQAEESVVLTLWDSPEKTSSLGRFSIPYTRRQWDQGMLMFTLEAAVEPGRQYYYELTVEGGDGKILGVLQAKGDYPEGAAYQGGKILDRDLWFETHVKKAYDRDALYKEFFDNFNLNHPGLEKVNSAVSSKDWDTACREFLVYMESKKDLFNDEDAVPKPDPSYDTKEADLVADQKWPAQDGTIVDLGPNWNYFATWPTIGGVGLTRTGLMKPLAFTYTKTGNEKYAKAWNSMLISMFRNVPCPLKSGVITTEGKISPLIPAGISGTLWDSISIAARLHHETFYNRFRKSPYFEPDVRMGWWANLADMVNTLERMEAGGNWTTQNTTSLFSFAQKYPEFKKSSQWFAQGFNGLKANFIDNMYPDGPCREATTGYHCFSLGMFFNVYKTARELGLEVPEEHLKRLETCFEYTMYTTQPDWQIPVWGDTNRPMDGAGLIEQGGRYFNRPDMLWVGTKGKTGSKPSKTSVDFPTAGYYIMRSGWDPQARFLVTRNGYSNSHYHSDNLSVIVNAYGVDLLPDAGIYTYGTPECNELTKTTSHSTISVDGKNILSGNGQNFWRTNTLFDYFEGTSPGYHDLKDVTHTRSILFIKPDYWVVADKVNGTGEHTSSQFWHFAPGKVTLDSQVTARTNNDSGGNISVIPLYTAGLEHQLAEDFYAVNWEKVTKAPVVRYERKGKLPHTFCTVLSPYPVGKPAGVRAKELVCDDVSLQPSVTGARVGTNDTVDYVVFNSSEKTISIDCGKLTTDAESTLIRTTAKTGKVMSFGLVKGTTLTFGKTVLASSNTPVTSLSVSYSGDRLMVELEESCPSLKIAALGAKRAVVNGKEVKLLKGAKDFRVEQRF